MSKLAEYRQLEKSLAEQLKRQNPAWSLEHCLTQAKLAITTKTAKA